jgi:hypothetical protein
MSGRATFAQNGILAWHENVQDLSRAASLHQPRAIGHLGIALVLVPGAGALALIWLIAAYAIAFGVLLIAARVQQTPPGLGDSLRRATQARCHATRLKELQGFRPGRESKMDSLRRDKVVGASKVDLQELFHLLEPRVLASTSSTWNSSMTLPLASLHSVKRGCLLSRDVHAVSPEPVRPAVQPGIHKHWRF